jgi:hypothetical protein
LGIVIGAYINGIGVAAPISPPVFYIPDCIGCGETFVGAKLFVV